MSWIFPKILRLRMMTSSSFFGGQCGLSSVSPALFRPRLFRLFLVITFALLLINVLVLHLQLVEVAAIEELIPFPASSFLKPLYNFGQGYDCAYPLDSLAIVNSPTNNNYTYVYMACKEGGFENKGAIIRLTLSRPSLTYNSANPVAPVEAPIVLNRTLVYTCHSYISSSSGGDQLVSIGYTPAFGLIYSAPAEVTDGWIYGITTTTAGGGYGYIYRFKSTDGDLITGIRPEIFFAWSAGFQPRYLDIMTLKIANGFVRGTAGTAVSSDSRLWLFEINEMTRLLTKQYSLVGSELYTFIVFRPGSDTRILGASQNSSSNSYFFSYDFALPNNPVTLFTLANTFQPIGPLTAINATHYCGLARDGASAVYQLYMISIYDSVGPTIFTYYSFLQTFSSSTTYSIGYSPFPRLISYRTSSNNDVIIGLCLNGGDYNGGVIFNYSLSSTSTNRIVSYSLFRDGSYAVPWRLTLLSSIDVPSIWNTGPRFIVLNTGVSSGTYPAGSVSYFTPKTSNGSSTFGQLTGFTTTSNLIAYGYGENSLGEFLWNDPMNVGRCLIVTSLKILRLNIVPPLNASVYPLSMQSIGYSNANTYIAIDSNLPAYFKNVILSYPQVPSPLVWGQGTGNSAITKFNRTSGVANTIIELYNLESSLNMRLFPSNCVILNNTNVYCMGQQSAYPFAMNFVGFNTTTPVPEKYSSSVIAWQTISLPCTRFFVSKLGTDDQILCVTPAWNYGAPAILVQFIVQSKVSILTNTPFQLGYPYSSILSFQDHLLNPIMNCHYVFSSETVSPANLFSIKFVSNQPVFTVIHTFLMYRELVLLSATTSNRLSSSSSKRLYALYGIYDAVFPSKYRLLFSYNPVDEARSIQYIPYKTSLYMQMQGLFSTTSGDLIGLDRTNTWQQPSSGADGSAAEGIDVKGGFLFLIPSTCINSSTCLNETYPGSPTRFNPPSGSSSASSPIGVAIGVTVPIVLIGLGVVFYLHRRKRKQANTATSGLSNNTKNNEEHEHRRTYSHNPMVPMNAMPQSLGQT